MLLLNCSLSTLYFIEFIFYFITGFDEWKENEEVNMSTRYVKHRRSRMNKNKTITTIYYCHCSKIFEILIVRKTMFDNIRCFNF